MSILSLHLLLCCVCMCVGGEGVCMACKWRSEDDVGAGVLLPPCRSQVLDSSHQARQQVPLPAVFVLSF